VRVVDIIAKKRDKQTNTEEEINFLIQSYLADESIKYQVAAWLMAAFLNGLTTNETAYLTKAMLNSGDILTINSSKPLVDKHSSGGVGDKISIPLAPLAASMGLAVPMMSGRALGITGGTVDKLEAITGYRTNLTNTEFLAIIKESGYAMTSQTATIAPADKLIYGLRDVTATVENTGLITASILSKKIAEGAQALLFDVKCGSGAFMKNIEQATNLANSLVQAAKAMGRPAMALITNMNQPLGLMTGNFLEIEESIVTLQGKGPADITALVVKQAAAMAVLGGLAKEPEAGEELAQQKLAGGEALEYFYNNIKLQGGDVAKLKADVGTRRAVYSYNITAREAGYLKIDAGLIGQSGVVLGVGRNKTEDTVDSEAGFIFNYKNGAKVNKGQQLVTLYASDEAKLAASVQLAEQAFSFSNEYTADELIYKVIS